MTRAGKTLSKTGPKSATIWTMEINLVFGFHAKGPWQAVLEIDSSATLEDLHFVILDVVGFDADHMYLFYVARTDRSHDRRVFEPEDGAVFETTLAKLFPLPKHRKLFYWFDFGDDWKFSISRVGTAREPLKRRKYPRVVSTRGKRPMQYPSCD